MKLSPLLWTFPPLIKRGKLTASIKLSNLFGWSLLGCDEKISDATLVVLVRKWAKF